MKKGYLYHRVITVAWLMAGVGGFGALLTVLLRVWLSPSLRDIDTGLYTTNTAVIVLMLVLLALLGLGAWLARGGSRCEIGGKPSLALSMVSLAVGAALTLFGGAEILSRLGVISFGTAAVSFVDAQSVNTTLQWLQSVFCLLGGVALARFGLSLASEGVTRRGMAQWSLLAPVLWVWFSLTNYEMSYASMVRLSDGFFTLMMYITEMMFLFIFARYVAGVGKVDNVVLLFFSSAATLFALSAPVARLLMYLLQDGAAFAAAGAAGLSDLAVGVLALTVSITLCQSLSASAVRESEEDVWMPPVSRVDLVESFDDAIEE